MIIRRFIGGGSVFVAALALTAAASGCSQRASDAPPRSSEGDADASEPRTDGGTTEPDDGGSDAGLDATSPSPGCTGSDVLSIVGDYVAADGSEYWLRTTPRATTYAEIPAGPPVTSAPPTLRRVVEVCGDQKSFVATDASGTFTRVDWAVESEALSLCVAAMNMADRNAALGAPSSNPSSKTAGCKGGPWIRVSSIKDGGR